MLVIPVMQKFFGQARHPHASLSLYTYTEKLVRTYRTQEINFEYDSCRMLLTFDLRCGKFIQGEFNIICGNYRESNIARIIDQGRSGVIADPCTYPI